MGLRRALRAELNSAGVDPAAVFDCLVAVTEACTNALTHGSVPDAGGLPPDVSWDLRPDCVVFYVRDFSGRQWSMAAHPSLSPAQRLQDRGERIGGFGMTMMRSLMDDVGVQVGIEGTTVVLRKNLR